MEFKYKSITVIVAAACAGVFALPEVASAGTVSGWSCVDLFQQNEGAVYYSSSGAIENDDSAFARSFGCPLVRSDPDLDAVSVYVNDRSATDSVECIAAELSRWGGGSWSPTGSTGNVYLGLDTLSFSDAQLASGDSSSQFVVSCDLPAENAANGRSAIFSIRWDES